MTIYETLTNAGPRVLAEFMTDIILLNIEEINKSAAGRTHVVLDGTREQLVDECFSALLLECKEENEHEST